MQVELSPGDPLFRHLAEWALAMQHKGIPTRLIGGGAMLLWSRYLETAPSMTGDLDCVLLSADFPSEEEATSVCSTIVAALDSIGFHRPKDWRSSRKARYCYENSADRVQIEFLAGKLMVGRASRRRPAWKVADLKGKSAAFYVAKVPALDHVTEWLTCQVRVGDRSVRIELPTLSGLLGLKLQALGDKIQRVQECQEGERAYETIRLQKHGLDSFQLFEWINDTGQFALLAAHIRAHPQIADLARVIARWLILNPEIVEKLELEGLGQHLGRIAEIGSQ